MKKFFAATTALAVLACPSMALAKKKPEMSTLELQQIQSKDFEASKSIVFSSVMTVLQDSGYRIGSADKDTGLITGTASTSSKLTWAPFVGFGRGKKTPVVSAYIEEIGSNYSKVRLNFVMGKITSNQFGSNGDEEPIYEPAVYKDAFEKIAQAVFIRQALATKGAETAGTTGPSGQSTPTPTNPN